MSYLDTDPTKPKQELLADIRAAAQQPHFPGLPLLPFANLLVKVGAEASETIESLKSHITELNEKNAKLQWWVVGLAIAAFISAVVQTIVAVAAFFMSPQAVPAEASASSAIAPTGKVPNVTPLASAPSAVVAPRAAPK